MYKVTAKLLPQCHCKTRGCQECFPHSKKAAVQFLSFVDLYHFDAIIDSKTFAWLAVIIWLTSLIVHVVFTTHPSVLKCHCISEACDLNSSLRLKTNGFPHKYHKAKRSIFSHHNSVVRNGSYALLLIAVRMVLKSLWSNFKGDKGTFTSILAIISHTEASPRGNKFCNYRVKKTGYK